MLHILVHYLRSIIIAYLFNLLKSDESENVLLMSFCMSLP